MKDLIGKVVDKNYRVDAFIESGGMGAVYRVWDLKRNVALAMKVLHEDLADDPSVFSRFEREANALKKLAHPNIVPFYGIRRTSDFAFLLERFIDGPSLKDILKQKRRQPFSIDEVLIYFKAICSALGYAHSNDVVHCDVKPGNVIVDQGGNVYLMDFGVARHADSTKTSLGTAGTPAYMAPEQILGKIVTPATDVYSLGVMLFEMLTGYRPFRGDGEATDSSGDTVHERIRYAHLHLPPPDPRTFNSSISSPVTQVILTALNKETTLRYPSAKELFEALCDAAGVSQEKVVDRAALPSEVPFSPSATLVMPGSLPKPKQSSSLSTSWLWIAGGGLGIILILLFCAFIFYLVLPTNPLATNNPPLGNIPTDTPPISVESTLVIGAISTEAKSTVDVKESFSEEFDEVPESWSPLVINGDASSWTPNIKNDSLFFDLASKNLGAYLLYDPVVYQDVKVTVVTENRGDFDSATSIICRYSEEGWYEFNITSKGLYRILYKSLDAGGKLVKEHAIANGGSAKIRPGKDINEYVVSCQGRTLSLSANGFEAASYTDNQYVLRKGLVGVGVTSLDRTPAVVYIDRVEIIQP